MSVLGARLRQCSQESLRTAALPPKSECCSCSMLQPGPPTGTLLAAQEFAQLSRSLGSRILVQSVVSEIRVWLPSRRVYRQVGVGFYITEVADVQTMTHQAVHNHRCGCRDRLSPRPSDPRRGEICIVCGFRQASPSLLAGRSPSPLPASPGTKQLSEKREHTSRRLLSVEGLGSVYGLLLVDSRTVAVERFERLRTLQARCDWAEACLLLLAHARLVSFSSRGPGPSVFGFLPGRAPMPEAPSALHFRSVVAYTSKMG